MRLLTLLAFIIMSINSNAQTKIFNNLLQKYVSANGKVDYKNLINEKEKLTEYIDYLKKTDYKSWSKNKQKAHLINAYNAYTLKAVLDNYPIKSIKDISFNGKNVWEHNFVNINGKTINLTHLENNIIRKEFKDPRIHVGVNCAAKSCPKLHNQAFTEQNIEKTLNTLMHQFLKDTSRNKISKNTVQLSKIFEWYKVDFTNNKTLVEYIQPYFTEKINTNSEIKFLFYNWNLNTK